MKLLLIAFLLTSCDHKCISHHVETVHKDGYAHDVKHPDGSSTLEYLGANDYQVLVCDKYEK